MVKQQYLKICINTCADPGIFTRGGGSGEGGPGQSAIKKSLTRFFVCFISTEVQWFISKKNCSRFQRGPTFFQGVGCPNFFPEGGGSNTPFAYSIKKPI